MINLILILCAIFVFYILTPNILIKLPIHNFTHLALIHAFLFASVWYILSNIIEVNANRYFSNVVKEGQTSNEPATDSNLQPGNEPSTSSTRRRRSGRPTKNVVNPTTQQNVARRNAAARRKARDRRKAEEGRNKFVNDTFATYVNNLPDGIDKKDGDELITDYNSDPTYDAYRYIKNWLRNKKKLNQKPLDSVMPIFSQAPPNNFPLSPNLYQQPPETKQNDTYDPNLLVHGAKMMINLLKEPSMKKTIENTSNAVSSIINESNNYVYQGKPSERILDNATVLLDTLNSPIGSPVTDAYYVGGTPMPFYGSGTNNVVSGSNVSTYGTNSVVSDSNVSTYGTNSVVSGSNVSTYGTNTPTNSSSTIKCSITDILNDSCRNDLKSRCSAVQAFLTKDGPIEKLGIDSEDARLTTLIDTIKRTIKTANEKINDPNTTIEDINAYKKYVETEGPSELNDITEKKRLNTILLDSYDSRYGQVSNYKNDKCIIK
jgi:hypothetical protein